jgi:integrase
LSLGWLPVPILTPRLWPKPQPKPKRGLTLEEHQRILAAEKNAERNLFYQLLWEVGAAQSDAAALTAENVDWTARTISYFRMKPGERAQLTISTPTVFSRFSAHCGPPSCGKKYFTGTSGSSLMNSLARRSNHSWRRLAASDCVSPTLFSF